MKSSGKGRGKAPAKLVQAITAPFILAAIYLLAGAGPALAAATSRPASAAAAQGLLGGILADHELIIAALALLVVLAAALIVARGHRRRADDAPRQAHARARGSRSRARDGRRPGYSAVADQGSGLISPAVTGDPWMPAPPRPPAPPSRTASSGPAPQARRPAAPPRYASAPPMPAAAPVMHADDYPSWPGPPGPYALHPDHPSWPGRPDPRWAATEAALQADDYPGWPGQSSPPWRDADPPAGPNAGGWPGHDGRGGGSAPRREPPARRGPHPATAPYGPPRTGTSHRPSAPVLPLRADTGSGPQAGTLHAGALRAGAAPGAVLARHQAPVRQESPAVVIDRVPLAADWGQPEPPQVWDAGSVQLATWIISEANQQAADIRREAHDLMSTSLAGAKQEAADLVRKASEQATATLEAAELQAAEIRATVTKLSADLGSMASYVTESLAHPAVAPPVSKPAPGPAVVPADGEAEPLSTTGLTTGTGTRPKPASAGKPGARPAGKPRPAAEPRAAIAAAVGTGAAQAKDRPRQLAAFRVFAVATAVLFLVAVVSGVAEVALHGLPFFIFRSTGTGETGPNGLQEDQGPGQPDAPKPTPSSIKAQSGPHRTVTVHAGS